MPSGFAVAVAVAVAYVPASHGVVHLICVGAMPGAGSPHGGALIASGRAAHRREFAPAARRARRGFAAVIVVPTLWLLGALETRQNLTLGIASTTSSMARAAFDEHTDINTASRTTTSSRVTEYDRAFSFICGDSLMSAPFTSFNCSFDCTTSSRPRAGDDEHIHYISSGRSTPCSRGPEYERVVGIQSEDTLMSASTKTCICSYTSHGAWCLPLSPWLPVLCTIHLFDYMFFIFPTVVFTYGLKLLRGGLGMTHVVLDVWGLKNAIHYRVRAARGGLCTFLVFLMVILFLPQTHAVSPHHREPNKYTFATVGAAAGFAIITVANTQRKTSILGKTPKFPWLNSGDESKRCIRTKLVVPGSPTIVERHTLAHLRTIMKYQSQPAEYGSLEKLYSQLYSEDEDETVEDCADTRGGPSGEHSSSRYPPVPLDVQ